jgi:hypothetical protein
MRTHGCATLALVLSICACVAPGPQIASPAPEAPVPPLATIGTLPIHGCLGETLDACVEELRLYVKVWQVRRPDSRVDVNGRKVGVQNEAHVNAPQTEFLFKMGPNEIIQEAHASLTDGSATPSSLRTKEEYDDTALFRTVFLILGSHCPTPTEFYRFFENKVKPGLEYHKEDSVGWHFATERVAYQVYGLQYCGRKFGYISSLDHSTDMMTIDNPSGVDRSAFLSFR